LYLFLQFSYVRLNRVLSCKSLDRLRQGNPKSVSSPIKPLVGSVTYGPVPATRPNHNCRQRLDRYHFAVEFQVPFALEDKINFRHALVKVGLGVLPNVHEMKTGRITGLCEGPPRLPAWARNRLKRIELGQ
jgi:hypothetical protein